MHVPILLVCASTALGAALALPGASPPAAAAETSPWLRYHERADHPWNRLDAALARRTDRDGRERVARGPDLPLWADSRHLLEPARRAELLAALDGVCADALAGAPTEPLRAEPLRAVCMQQDLWALHDWAVAARPPHEDLAAAAARALAALAPTAQALAQLPDNLAATAAQSSLASAPDALFPLRPFLPPQLQQLDGEWVRLALPDGGDEPLALAHAMGVGGRSDFEVRLRLPGGRAETLRWLDGLRAQALTATCAGSWCAHPEAAGKPHEHLNRALPALPPGSAVALLRRALAFDDRGELHVTALVQSVQVRAFLPVPAGVVFEEDVAEPPHGWPWQALCELALDRGHPSASRTARLLPVEDGDALRFDPLREIVDPLQSADHGRPAHLDSCVGCHGNVGLASVNTFTGFSSGPRTHFDFALRASPRRLAPADEAAAARVALAYKRARADWRALRARIDGG